MSASELADGLICEGCGERAWPDFPGADFHVVPACCNSFREFIGACCGSPDPAQCGPLIYPRPTEGA